MTLLTLAISIALKLLTPVAAVDGRRQKAADSGGELLNLRAGIGLVATRPVDFRKGMDGLAAPVRAWAANPIAA